MQDRKTVHKTLSVRRCVYVELNIFSSLSDTGNVAAEWLRKCQNVPINSNDANSIAQFYTVFAKMERRNWVNTQQCLGNVPGRSENTRIIYVNFAKEGCGRFTTQEGGISSRPSLRAIPFCFNAFVMVARSSVARARLPL